MKWSGYVLGLVCCFFCGVLCFITFNFLSDNVAMAGPDYHRRLKSETLANLSPSTEAFLKAGLKSAVELELSDAFPNIFSANQFAYSNVLLSSICSDERFPEKDRADNCREALLKMIGEYWKPIGSDLQDLPGYNILFLKAFFRDFCESNKTVASKFNCYYLALRTFGDAIESYETERLDVPGGEKGVQQTAQHLNALVQIGESIRAMFVELEKKAEARSPLVPGRTLSNSEQFVRMVKALSIDDFDGLRKLFKDE